jgi:Na+/H+-dicarboxylate symporter
MKFWIKMVAGLVMGIIVGSYIGHNSIFLEPMRTCGILFFRVLNFLVFPLVFFTTIRSVIFLRSNKRLFVVLVKAIGYFILLTAIGATIGVVLGDVLKPGAGMNIGALESPDVLHYPETAAFIQKIVPDSIVGFLKSGFAVLTIVFVSFIIGSGILLARENADEFHALIVSIDATLHKLTIIILEFLPIGIFAYVGYMMGFMTKDSIMSYLKLVIIVIGGSFIQIFIIHAILVFILTRLNPFTFIHAVLPAAVLGYITGNGYTAYPALVECVEHNLGTDRQVFTFVSAVGTALSLSGSGVAAGVSTLFVAQAYGLDLSVYLQIIIVFLITVSSLKLDGQTGASLVLLSVVLSQVIKLPAEGYALVLGISAILFQIETLVNVVGNGAVSYILSSSIEPAARVRVRDFL